MSQTAGKTIHCKAAICWAAGEELKVEEIEVAPPQAHEVRIQILHTGELSRIDSLHRYPFAEYVLRYLSYGRVYSQWQGFRGKHINP
jgi:hypothetical protein